METNQLTATETQVISSEQLLKHWQGHRALTRRVIEAFPEDKLFNYSIGGMRSFAVMAMEIVDLTDGGIEGLVTGQWKSMEETSHVTGNIPQTKADLLDVWDGVTEKLDTLWHQLAAEKFQEEVVAFGAYPGKIYSTLFYIIDNEIHHRGQGYVYLRSLGIEPPAFWDRP